MRYIVSLLIACVSATLVASTAQAQIGSVSVHVSVTKVDVSWTYDGKQSEQTVALTMKALTQEGAVGIGKFAVAQNTKLQHFKLLEAYTLKADGSKTQLTEQDIKVQDGSVAAGYGVAQHDTKITQGTFPNVAVGDSIYYSYTLTQHTPLLPEWHSFSGFLVPQLNYDSVSYTIRTINGAKLFVKATGKGWDTKQSADGDTETWVLKNASKSTFPETDWANSLQTMPMVMASSIENYAELGNRYAAIVEPMMATTDVIKQLSQTIVGSSQTDVEKIQKIYDWVRKNIRYVATYLGAGGWQPHTIDWILQNKYGDCKDHVLLLQALLKAQGIASQGALINTQAEYELQPIAIATFNHIIAYVPSLKLYLDPTSENTPYPQLTALNAGRPVVLIGLTGLTGLNASSIARTPALEPAQQKVTAHAEIKIDTLGNAKVRYRYTGAGLIATDIRSRMKQIPAGMSGKAVSQMLQESGLKGSGFLKFNDPTLETETFSVEGHLTLSDVLPSTETGAIIPHVLALKLSTYPDMNNQFVADKRETAMMCNASDVTNTFEVAFDGINILRLPKDLDIKSEFLDYTASYQKLNDTSYKGAVRLVKKFNGVCTPAQYQTIRPIAGQIVQHMRQQVLYAKP